MTRCLSEANHAVSNRWRPTVPGKNEVNHASVKNYSKVFEIGVWGEKLFIKKLSPRHLSLSCFPVLLWNNKYGNFFSRFKIPAGHFGQII